MDKFGSWTSDFSYWVDKHYRQISLGVQATIIVSASFLIYKYQYKFKGFDRTSNIPKEYFQEQRRIRGRILSTKTKEDDIMITFIHTPFLLIQPKHSMSTRLFGIVKKSDEICKILPAFTNISCQIIPLYKDKENVLVSRVLLKQSVFGRYKDLSFLLASSGFVNIREHELPGSDCTSDTKLLRLMNSHIDSLDEILKRAASNSRYSFFKPRPNS